MRKGITARTVFLFLLAACHLPPSLAGKPSVAAVERDNSNPLNIDWGPAPPPDQGPPLSAGALRDPKYLPAQIGGIVGSYAFCLVLVASALLILAKRRRDHLRGADEATFEYPVLDYPGQFVQAPDPYEQYPVKSPRSPAPNFSYPDPLSPTRTERSEFTGYIFPSPTSTSAPGVDLHVDQSVVARDHNMAQQQLEDMYKHVMEQEAAKEAGVEYHGPSFPQPSSRTGSTTTLTKREKAKPTSLNLSADSEKTQSRSSSIFSVLRSPRKKAPKGLSISSPIMTPMSGTFPRSEVEEMNPLSPRHYAPPPPPPVPAGEPHVLPARQRRNTGGSGSLPTPDISPQSTQSIDERIGALPGPTPRVDTFAAAASSSHNRMTSLASTIGGGEPASAVSDTSTAPLVGLPTSPKPGVNRFPSLAELPKSPVPGQSFPRLQQQTAVRSNGSLPLRAYEPSLASPSFATHNTTKQTVFERKQGPLSPGLRTPWTGAPVPYSPYQPFSPVIPITPSLVTKEDRKRMKKMEPKTPTMNMVQSQDDIW